MADKASIMQKKCLDQFKEFMDDGKHKLIGEWSAKRWRVRTKRGYLNIGEDLFGKEKVTIGKREVTLGFDIALAYEFGSIISFFFIQVKSRFERSYYEAMQKKWRNANAFCYLSVYGDWAKKDDVKIRPNTSEKNKGKLYGEVIKLKDFKVLRIY